MNRNIAPPASIWEYIQNGGKIEQGMGHAALLELRDRAALVPGVGRTLQEAAANVPNAGPLFDASVRLSVFEGFNEANTLYNEIAFVDRSPEDVKRYVKLRPLPGGQRTIPGEEVQTTSIGLIDEIDIGAPYLASRLVVTATEIRADMHSAIAMRGKMFGDSMAYTIEKVMFDLLTDTSKYTRTKAKKDNDATSGTGANTLAIDLTFTNLELVNSIVGTMKDRETGVPGNYSPDCVITGMGGAPNAAKLLNSMQLGHGTADDAGTTNPWYGIVKPKVSRLLTGNQWIMADTMKMGLALRIAQDFVLSDGGDYPMARSLTREYTGSVASGAGFLDDRAFFFGSGA